MLIIDDEIQLALEVRLPDRLRDALKLQLERVSDNESLMHLSRRVSDGVAKGLESALDVDLQAPTAPQIAFARAVSSKLGIPLPHEALLQRKALSEYLDKYSARFKQLTLQKSR